MKLNAILTFALLAALDITLGRSLPGKVPKEDYHDLLDSPLGDSDALPVFHDHITVSKRQRVVATKPLGCDGVDETNFWNVINNLNPVFGPDVRLLLYVGLAVDDLPAVKKDWTKATGGTMLDVWDILIPLGSAQRNTFDAAREGPMAKKYAGMLSVTYGAVVANHPQEAGVLYYRPEDENFPPGSFLTKAELPYVTGPGSQTTRLVRFDPWNRETQIRDLAANNQGVDVLWQNGCDAQIGSTAALDLTT